MSPPSLFKYVQCRPSIAHILIVAQLNESIIATFDEINGASGDITHMAIRFALEQC